MKDSTLKDKLSRDICLPQAVARLTGGLSTAVAQKSAGWKLGIETVAKCGLRASLMRDDG